MKLNNADVAVGADGFLFLRKGSNQVAEQLAGRYPLPADFKAQWRALLANRVALAESLGARHAFFIAPAKECVLEDLLPEDLVVTPARPVTQVLAAAEGVAQVIYPLEAFKAHPGQTFAQNDSHWRAEGSVLAYRILMEALGITALRDDEIQIVPGSMNDLGVKIGMAERSEPQFPLPISPRHTVISDNRIKPLGNLVVTEIDDPTLPTAVIFRDSFLSASHRLFAQHFRRLVFVWQPNLDLGIIEREQPDFIITALAERFLVVVPDDAHGKTNAEHVAQKLLKAAV